MTACSNYLQDLNFVPGIEVRQKLSPNPASIVSANAVDVFVKAPSPKAGAAVIPPGNPDESSSQEKYGKTYLVANTPELLMLCYQELEAATVFSFDTETTGLDRIADTAIGISVSTKAKTGWYIPLLQKHMTGWLNPNVVLETLAPIFRSPQKTKVAHNLKFDLQMFANTGIEIQGPLVIRC